ncbi:hypothetical protein LOCC1_G000209 [Lachnellula occidentalis]|uniref:Serine-rich protein n=1 Tax=Lachnellula occidentalis TaxID=215460 RepID=A0A8H8S9V7_9HELO|nr:hypothetical protein LOCC1_G000209 [Lachnellula occidentalis]
MSEGPPSRHPLHERSNSQSNTISAIRLVPSTPPRHLGEENEERDEVYGRTPLPTHPSHILLAPGHGRGKDKDPTSALAPEFQATSKAQGEANSSGSSVSTHTTHQLPQNADSATGSTLSKPKRLPKKGSKKRLQIHKDSKTFSLLQDDPQSVQGIPQSPTISIVKKSSYDSLAPETLHAKARSNPIDLCLPLTPATPASEEKQPISADHISSSPWNYQLVGGLRKVPKTPDIKQKSSAIADSPLPPLPPLPEVYNLPSAAASHDLSAKTSVRSTQTTTTTSDNTNYKVYGSASDSASEVAFQSPSSNNSNYQVFGDPSEAGTASSVIHRPQTGDSEDENYESHGDPSLAGSSVNLVGGSKYSHESLVVPPLRPRTHRSNESLGYYKSRSRESLRTAGSLTSISTVLSQQEAAQAIVGSGSLIQLPIPNRATASSSWAENTHPSRSHMNEQPHQWSSQLSTVLSVSDGGTERGSRSWSDNSGRISGAFPSTPSRNSRNSRQMLSISSSLAQEEGRSESPISPPDPAFTRGGRRHQSSSSVPVVGDQDEHGDGITDMQDLRARPSRTRLSRTSTNSSENGRSNTMRSTGSSRANSLLSSSMPKWAKLYYGSGERRYLFTPGAPGSSTEGSDSRSGSFRSGSPNTDNFPLSIYSPRRRPREVEPNTGRPLARGSLEITPAPLQENNVPDTRRLRTWSLSSVWSPHLRHDRRATGHSMWDPPSISWSTDGSWFGRRNVQIVMFTLGFIFPFAWMIAAFLPLPPNPMTEMRERDVENSTSNLDSSNAFANDFARQFGPADEIRFESAKWWRNLNRWMSIVGLLIIAAVVVLVVIGVREGWTKS